MLKIQRGISEMYFTQAHLKQSQHIKWIFPEKPEQKWWNKNLFIIQFIPWATQLTAHNLCRSARAACKSVKKTWQKKGKKQAHRTFSARCLTFIHSWAMALRANSRHVQSEKGTGLFSLDKRNSWRSWTSRLASNKPNWKSNSLQNCCTNEVYQQQTSPSAATPGTESSAQQCPHSLAQAYDQAKLLPSPDTDTNLIPLREPLNAPPSSKHALPQLWQQLILWTKVIKNAQWL